ncbi:MAG: ATP-binding cassette domain-containing protein, partial [Burkholderiaceae bacterium]
EPTSGQVIFKGTDLAALNARDLRRARRDLQIVFQDPYSSLNPRMRAGAIVEEPLIIHRIGTREERRARVAELFGLVGLDPAQSSKFPHEFSGGQRQRIGLARALALDPEILIADEPVSALDVSVQAQVLSLLADLKARLGLSMLFVTHDLRVAAQICDRIVVMKAGKVVESGPTAEVFANPKADYTRELLEAIPGREWSARALPQALVEEPLP